MSSKSRTGIKALDKAVDATVNGASAIGKNMEKNLGHSLALPFRILKGGDLSGIAGDIGRTMLTGASLGMANWDEVKGTVKANGVNLKDMGDVAVERMEQAATDAERAAAAAVTADNLRARRNTIAGLTAARVMAPGRSSVIRQAGSINSLLTYI